MRGNKKEEDKKKSDKDFPKTYVITAAQGIQNPYNSRMYGRDSDAGTPNKPLIKNIEDYVELNEAELQICSIPGSYVNEIELDEFFHDRDDVYVEKNAKRRNEQNRKKEEKRRERWRAGNSGFETGEGSPEFLQELGMPMHFFWEDIPYTDYKITGKRLNSNVRVVGIPEPSQNKDPLTGKDVFTQKHGGNSIIIPSPKRRLKAVADGQAGEYPKIMMTTGCCTHPSYNTTNRQGFLADEGHRYGFAVVDCLDDKLYLPRMVPAQRNGTFVDLGVKYAKGKDPERIGATTLVVGDSHVAEINPKVEKANKEMIVDLQPKHVHYHDVFAAATISIHGLNSEIERANRARSGLSKLEEELVLTGEYIRDNAMIAKEYGGQIIINASNHDDMLFRWLDGGHYRKDDINRITGYQILGEGVDRLNCFEKAIRRYCEIPDNVTFLELGEDAKYRGIQCGAHGHKGKNGARGTLKSLMEGYGKVIMGHVHTLEVNGDSMSVGTSTLIPLDYQLGTPSTSMAGNGVIYENGLMQAIPIIKGKWRRDDFYDSLKK